jgi:hypothetical protein
VARLNPEVRAGRNSPESLPNLKSLVAKDKDLLQLGPEQTRSMG